MSKDNKKDFDLLDDSLSYKSEEDINNSKNNSDLDSSPEKENDSGSDISDLGKEKDKDSFKKETPEDKRRNEVRKEFITEFKKKIAKYIPPKINFKGNLLNRTIVKEKYFDGKFVSNLTFFKDYILITVESELQFYNKNLELIFRHKFVEEKNEVLSLNVIDDQTIIMGAEDNLQIINFFEKVKNQITFEVIQEMKETNFYCLNVKLHNGYVLIGGMDRKYGFYEISNRMEKISKNNKLQLKFKIHKIHNVYDDDCPRIEDLNNGRLISWLIDDKNIKIIEYTTRKPRIIKSMNGYGLHDAALINDKYLLLMGLTYPQYYSWLMDTESLEIIHKWKTPQNDSFMCSLCENKFLYGSETRFALDEFSSKDGKYIRTKIYESKYIPHMTDDDWEDQYGIRYFLDEYTFVATNIRGKIMIFKCSN